MDDGSPIHGHTGLEIVWTLIPTILVTCIADLLGRRARPVRRPALGSPGGRGAPASSSPGRSPTRTSRSRAASPLTTGELVLPDRPDRRVRDHLEGRHPLVLGARVADEAGRGPGHHDADDRQADGARRPTTVICTELCGLGHARHALAGARPLHGRLRGVGRGAEAARPRGRVGAGQGALHPAVRQLPHARGRGDDRARSARTSTTSCRARTRTSSMESIVDPSAEIAAGYEDVMPGQLRRAVHRAAARRARRVPARGDRRRSR